MKIWRLNTWMAKKKGKRICVLGIMQIGGKKNSWWQKMMKNRRRIFHSSSSNDGWPTSETMCLTFSSFSFWDVFCFFSSWIIKRKEDWKCEKWSFCSLLLLLVSSSFMQYAMKHRPGHICLITNVTKRMMSNGHLHVFCSKWFFNWKSRKWNGHSMTMIVMNSKTF